MLHTPEHASQVLIQSERNRKQDILNSGPSNVFVFNETCKQNATCDSNGRSDSNKKRTTMGIMPPTYVSSPKQQHRVALLLEGPSIPSNSDFRGYESGGVVSDQRIMNGH